jgi:phosphoglycerate dehydrogenase-like enzyme
MTELPVVLLYSGIASEDAQLAELILAKYPELPLLTANSEQELVERLPQAEVLYAYAFLFPIRLIHHAERLRWFQVMGVGVEGLVGFADVIEERDVQVTNARGIFDGAMAEYALAYILAHAQDVRRIVRQQAAREWTQFQPLRIQGMTVGILGLGSIGSEVARLCAAAGLRVIGTKRSPGTVANVERVYTVDQIDEFLPECDFLVSVLPHTTETVGLLNRDRLRRLKPSCFLVNMGRGTVFVEADLVEALREGWLAGAALDVFPEEPLPAGNPLWGLENVYVTPHISGLNRPEWMADVFLRNLERYSTGQPLLHQVDLRRGY